MSKKNLVFDLKSRQMVPANLAPQTVQKSWEGTVREFANGYSPGDMSQTSLKSPFEHSVWVRSAIAHCFNPIKTVPLKLSQAGEEFEQAEVADFLANPAAAPGGRFKLATLIEACTAWWKLNGEFFLILDDTWLRDRPESIRFKSPAIVARPDEMQEVCDGGQVVGWRYQPAGGKYAAQLLIADQVIHKKAFNPGDKIRGLSDWESAKMATDSDYAAGKYAKHVMDSNGDTGPIVTGEGTISEEQEQQVKRALREKQRRSRNGEKPPLFLVGSGLKVTEPTAQSIDSDYVGQRLANRHEIYIAFGVPPSFAEVMASYSVGSASDRLRNIEDNCQPMAVEIADALEEMLNGHGVRPAVLEAAGGFVEVAFEWDEHPTKQQVRGERTTSAVELVKNGMPWDVASDYLNLNLPPFPGSDAARVPASAVEVGEVAPEIPAEPLPPAEDKTPDPLAQIRKAFEGRKKTIVTKAPSLVAPAFMAASAKRGLKLHEEGNSGDGLRPATVRDARKMAQGEALSVEKWRKIAPWIARHTGDLDAVDGDEITPGLVAMLLWGGGSSKTSAKRAQEYAERIVSQLESSKSQTKALSESMEEPGLNEPDPEKVAIWKTLDARRAAWRKRYRSRISRLLMSARKLTLQRIEQAGEAGRINKSLVLKNGAVDLVFDLPDWLTEFLEGMTEVSRRTMQSAVLELWQDELGRDDDPATMPDRLIRRVLQERRNLLAETAQSIYDDIKDELIEGVENGETMAELSGRVRSAFNGINDSRAEAIATTEVTAVYEKARQSTLEAAGVTHKEWITSGLPNVRFTHFQANGQIVKIDENFEVGGHSMAHPGDPNGPPEEVINCRCMTIASTGSGLKGGQA